MNNKDLITNNKDLIIYIHASNADKELDKGVIEAIELNSKNDREINYFLAAHIFTIYFWVG